MALNNDFKIKNRLFSTQGAFFGNYPAGSYSINTQGHILSANINLFSLFATAASVAGSTSVFTTVNANSANWTGAYTAVSPNSANWNSNYAITFANSANWSSAYTAVSPNSANWNSNYTNTFNNSANWNSNYAVTFANSANWNSNYAITFANSANWSSVYSNVNASSARRDSVYTNVNTSSANWNGNYATTFANSANWSSAYTAVSPNSANWNSDYAITFANSANWNSNYSTTFANSANWGRAYSNISTNSASLVTNITNAGSQGNINVTQLGGSVGGLPLTNLTTGGSPEFYNLTIRNNLSVLGDFTFLNTSVSVTSALSVVNYGTGPALYVKQGGLQPIAHFLDADGTGDIIFDDKGFVGIGTAIPVERLTVAGNISSTRVIYASGGNSNLWNSTYTYVNTASSFYILNGGNAGAVTIGTTDANSLQLETNNATKLTILAGGNVGIGTTVPGEKLSVSGNISSNGTGYLSGAILTGILPTAVTTGQRLVTVETNGTLTYDQLGVGEAIITGKGLTSNKLVKSTNDPTILSAGSITDTISGVAIDKNIPFIIGAYDAATSNNEYFSVKQLYSKNIVSTGTTISTLLTAMPMRSILLDTSSRLMQIKYNVLLYTDSSPTYANDQDRTAFEVLAPVGSGVIAGTVYAIVDTFTTLLNDIDLNIVGTTAVLTISSMRNCVGLIEATGYYGPALRDSV